MLVIANLIAIVEGNRFGPFPFGSGLGGVLEDSGPSVVAVSALSEVVVVEGSDLLEVAVLEEQDLSEAAVWVSQLVEPSLA